MSVTAESPGATAVPADGVCAHCGGPLPRDVARPPGSPAFCCYGCRVLGARPESLREDRPDAHRVPNPWVRIGLGAAIASQAMVLGLALNLSEPEGTARTVLHGILIASALGVMALLGWPLARASWECACRRTLGVEWLFLSGVVGAFGASLWSTFTGIGAVYYEVVAVLLTVYTGGKALTASARSKALSETGTLRSTFATATRADGCVVPVSEVAVGDTVRVLPGEVIPVDGRIVAGEAFVRGTPLTGEPEPVVRRVGDTVLAGGFSEDGELRIEATTPGNRRRIDALLEAVETARGTLGGTRAQAQADRLAAVFLPLVLAVAFGTFAFWSWQGRWREGLFHALSVLLVACPCALGLATPLGLWQALVQLAAHGVQVRDADAVERLAEVDAVVFDKTGTLTEDRMSLVDFVAIGSAEDRRSLLSTVAAVEARSRHPVARAFLDAGAGTSDAPAAFPEVLDFRNVPAHGVEATVRQADGTTARFRIGTADWIVDDAHRDTATALEGRLRAAQGAQPVWVARDDRPVALAQVRERVRAGLDEALVRLRTLSVSLAVFSGDRHERVEAVAESLGEDAAELPRIAGMAPEDKAARIVSLRAEGRRVLFLGDGLNDAPALKAADVGLAVAEGAPVAVAVADGVLHGGDLRNVARAIQVARNVRDSIHGNLLFAATYNVLGMALAASGHLHPVAAALLMAGSSVVVGWRAWRHDGCDSTPSPADAGRLRRFLVPVSLLTQVPVLALLGRLRPSAVAVVAVAGLLLAGLALEWNRRRAGFGARPRALGDMTWEMLGPAGLGMLAGWWAEAGFQAVMQEDVCLCCSGHAYFGPGWKVPWMVLGMAAAGLPGMWRSLARWDSRWGRWPAAAGVVLGMAVGMGTGATVALRVAGPMHPWQFLIAFAGMTGGMLAGMFFACTLAEAAGPAWRSLVPRAAPRR